MWEKNALLNRTVIYAETPLLFEQYKEEYELPKLEESIHDQVFDEIELLGFPVSISPFHMLQTPTTGGILANQLPSYLGKNIDIIGYFITRKYVRTAHKKLMNFGTFIDREGKFFDTIHFPKSLSQFPFMGRGIYHIKGKVVSEFDFHSIEVMTMEKIPFVKDERY